MSRRALVLALLLACLAPAHAKDQAADGSIGVCTRKEEFAKRQESLDAKVAAVTKEKDEGRRRKLAVALAAAADSDIECLMRYREPALVPTFLEVTAKSKKWFTRTRAIQTQRAAERARATVVRGLSRFCGTVPAVASARRYASLPAPAIRRSCDTTGTGATVPRTVAYGPGPCVPEAETVP